jgi:3-oxoacyl-[acyl-carrier-protein] synthase-1
MNNGMSNQLYIAGTGMITSISPSATSTYLAVAAHISGYQLSHYLSKDDEPVTMALVPEAVFDAFEYELEECNPYNAQFDHTIKMAIIAVQQIREEKALAHPIPLLLAMPEPEYGPAMPNGLLIRNLAEHCAPAITSELTRSFHSGRAAGMEAIDFAFRYLANNPLVIIGGSDSPIHMDRIQKLDELDRLLTIKSSDGFAPGEGACFLLLTSDPQLAQERNGYIIAIHPPGLAEEPGHMYSDATYRGDGLDEAFKKTLASHAKQSVQAIYSSMNGENFWAKEYGVAYLRSKSKFTDSVRLEHPADCYGDLGSATTMALITMAANSLWSNKHQYKHLVYSSSDTAKRGALIVEKIKTSQ